MQEMVALTRKFLRSDDGPTVCEYAIMIALIVVVAIVTIQLLGVRMSSIFSAVPEAIDA